VKIFVLVVALVMYGLVIAFSHRKALISLVAAAVIVAAGTIFPAAGGVTVVRALTELVSWNILAIYVGSLVIADLFIYSRVPAALADVVVERSPTLGIAIVMILVITGFLSAFVENVATVLVMAPIALEICRRLKLDPTSFMVGLAVMANLQGTATLVGDPPSMIFASYAGYGFNDFFFHGGKASIFFVVQAGAVVGALFFAVVFRKLKKIHIDLPMEKIVSWVPTLLLVGMVVGLAAISFASSGGIHASSGALCLGLGLAGLLWLVLVRREPVARAAELVKRLDWETILFLVGIFVVVGAIGHVGLLDDLAAVLRSVVGSSVLLGFVAIVAISVLISGFVDNVPYIIAMLPVAGTLAQTMGSQKELLMFGLLVGSCLGGNLTPFGASANVVAVSLVRKEGRRMGFLDWVRIGAPFTVLTTLASSLVLYAIWR
jgi:Na+/H+ antiporter NhaD/arsenite permease-like protein